MACRIWMAVLLLPLGSAAVHADPVEATRRSATASASALHVSESEGLVTVRAHGEPLADVLEELARVTGLTLASRNLPDAQVIVDLQRRPLAEVLAHILGGRSFVFYQAGVSSMAASDDGRRPTSVLWLYPDGSESRGVEGSSISAAGHRELPSSLVDGDLRDRLQAVKAARKSPADDALETLSLALTDADAKVRVKAIYGLVDVGGSGAVSALASALGDENPGVREEAVYALGTIGGAEVPGLLEYALDDPDPGVRESAIKALAESGGQESVGVLTATLGDVDADTRRAAIDALVDIASPAAVVAIETALEDDADSVREAARDALTDLSMSPTKPDKPGSGEDH